MALRALAWGAGTWHLLFYGYSALTVLFGSRKLGSGWTTDGPGAGYFPFYIGLILCISGAGTLYQALLGKKRNTEIFVDGEQIRRVLSVLIPAAFYVLANAFVLWNLYVIEEAAPESVRSGACVMQCAQRRLHRSVTE